MSQHQKSNNPEPQGPHIVVEQVIDEAPAGSKITGLTADDDTRGVSVRQVIKSVGPGSEIIGYDGSHRR